MNLRLEEGLLFHLIEHSRTEVAGSIKASGRIETAVIGLGSHGLRHAGLMQSYGTTITAGVSSTGDRILGSVPVYQNVRDCLAEHPNIAIASVWRPPAVAARSALEAIESGIAVVVVITEGIPLRDTRDLIAASRRKGTILIGPNTPGMVFPPERIKVGMLPDIFAAQEESNGQNGPRGLAILSRSGAVLYHVSDALSSVGIAQNAVIGVGGDGAIGSTFRELVPLIIEHEATDLVLVAGEIGGMQEELLARDIRNRAHLYQKPLVTLLTGANAREGVRMGHAGALSMPGQSYGSFHAKREAFREAGVTVVNSQNDLVNAVKRILGDRKYFDVSRYRARMKAAWERPPVRPSWPTTITKVERNGIWVAGYALGELISRASLLETVHLVMAGELPLAKELERQQELVITAAQEPTPVISAIEGEESPAIFVKCLLSDDLVWRAWRHADTEIPAEGTDRNAAAVDAVNAASVAIGRALRYAAQILAKESGLGKSGLEEPGKTGDTVTLLSEAFAGVKYRRLGRMIEAMIVACVDHGVTPPSAQAAHIAASVRSPYPLVVAAGVSAISDLHGGAGEEAAAFFDKCRSDRPADVVSQYLSSGRRIAGLGHRVHTKDPRVEPLLSVAEEQEVAAESVGLARRLSTIVAKQLGSELPLNVDGVIGAICSDLGLPHVAAKILFIVGRIAGLSAHYYEEIMTQSPMRRIDFEAVEYAGYTAREYVEKD